LKLLLFVEFISKIEEERSSNQTKEPVLSRIEKPYLLLLFSSGVTLAYRALKISYWIF